MAAETETKKGVRLHFRSQLPSTPAPAFSAASAQARGREEGPYTVP